MIEEQMAKQSSERLACEPEVVVIPLGPFMLGSAATNPLRSEDEPDLVALDLPYSYAIGVHPVTVDQFRAFITAGGYAQRRYWTDTGWQVSEGRTQPDHWHDGEWAGDALLPVIGVSWYEADAYARWLSQTTGRIYRLPSEAEWEKAARGGLLVPDGHGGFTENALSAREWPWGDEAPDERRLNFGSMVGHTSPVGNYPAGASPYGALDLAGNVWEWCGSRWAYHYAFPEDTSHEGDEDRVVRGGSWFNTAAQARCAYRLRLMSNLRFDHDVGFRLVLSDG
jgi:formylglycine-generating enzyme required for sulfatase activity